MVYHHDAVVDIITEGVYHQPQAASSFAMMIYNTSCWWYTMLCIDDIHGSRRDLVRGFKSIRKLTKISFLFIQAAGLAYHHDAVVDIIKGGNPPLYLITRQRVSSCGLMISSPTDWWYTATSCGWYTRLTAWLGYENAKSYWIAMQNMI